MALAAAPLVLAACAVLSPTPRPTLPVTPPELTLAGHRHTITSLAISADGTLLASGSRDGRVRLWRLPSGELAGVLVHDRWLRSLWAVALSPDGRLVASAADDMRVVVWGVADRRPVAILRGHESSIRALAWSPDERVLASGSRDTTVRLWDVPSGRETALLSHANTVRSLAFSPDGRTLFTGTAEDVIRAWDVRGARAIATARHENTVHALAVTPDGGTLVSGAADRTVRLWTVPGLAERAVLALDRTRETPTPSEQRGLYPGPEVMALAVSPDGRFVASGHRDSAIRIWDLGTLRLAAEIRPPAWSTYALVFARDGLRLYAGGDDRRIHRFDVEKITRPAARPAAPGG